MEEHKRNTEQPDCRTFTQKMNDMQVAEAAFERDKARHWHEPVPLEYQLAKGNYELGWVNGWDSAVDLYKTKITANASSAVMQSLKEATDFAAKEPIDQAMIMLIDKSGRAYAYWVTNPENTMPMAAALAQASRVATERVKLL